MPSPSQDPVLRNLDTRAGALRDRVGPLHEGMAQAGVLGEFREILREDLRSIMVMLGHTTPEVAMIYQAAGEQRMKDIASRMDDAFAEVQDDDIDEADDESPQSDPRVGV